MRNNPKMQKLMDATQAVYPDMDFQKYGERQQFVRGYANKSPSQFGGQLVSIEHTADLVGQQADRYASSATARAASAATARRLPTSARTSRRQRTAEHSSTS
jgi:hypothetical protein